MFSFRFLSAGLAFALSLAWLTLAPASVQAQGFCGPPVRDNCSPSRYQLMQGRQYQQALNYQALSYQQSLMYQQAAMQQQLAFQQVAFLMNAQQIQLQLLQQLTAPPAQQAVPVVAAGPAGFVDPLLRPVGVAKAAAPPAPVAQPAEVRDPFQKPVVVRDAAPVREVVPAVEPPPGRTKEEEAGSKLKLAKMLANDGFTDKARLRYNEIAEKFPGTKAASEAETLLAKR